MITMNRLIACLLLLSYVTAIVGVKYGDKITYKDKDMMRKSIVFDKKTPDLFYCPMQKPSTMNKLIVRSRPLHKLCEYEGKPLPPQYKSDCYQDIDESDYACKEKYRIMMRMYPPGSEQPFNGTRLKRFLSIDEGLHRKSDVKTVVNYRDVFLKQ